MMNASGMTFLGGAVLFILSCFVVLTTAKQCAPVEDPPGALRNASVKAGRILNVSLDEVSSCSFDILCPAEHVVAIYELNNAHLNSKLSLNNVPIEASIESHRRQYFYTLQMGNTTKVEFREHGPASSEEGRLAFSWRCIAAESFDEPDGRTKRAQFTMLSPDPCTNAAAKELRPEGGHTNKASVNNHRGAPDYNLFQSGDDEKLIDLHAVEAEDRAPFGRFFATTTTTILLLQCAKCSDVLHDQSNSNNQSDMPPPCVGEFAPRAQVPSSSPTTTKVAIIVSSVVILVFAIAVGVFIYRRRSRRSTSEKAGSNDGHDSGSKTLRFDDPMTNDSNKKGIEVVVGKQAEDDDDVDDDVETIADDDSVAVEFSAASRDRALWTYRLPSPERSSSTSRDTSTLRSGTVVDDEDAECLSSTSVQQQERVEVQIVVEPTSTNAAPTHLLVEVVEGEAEVGEMEETTKSEVGEEAECDHEDDTASSVDVSTDDSWMREALERRRRQRKNHNDRSSGSAVATRSSDADDVGCSDETTQTDDLSEDWRPKRKASPSILSLDTLHFVSTDWQDNDDSASVASIELIPDAMMDGSQS